MKAVQLLAFGVIFFFLKEDGGCNESRSCVSVFFYWQNTNRKLLIFSLVPVYFEIFLRIES